MSESRRNGAAEQIRGAFPPWAPRLCGLLTLALGLSSGGAALALPAGEAKERAQEMLSEVQADAVRLAPQNISRKTYRPSAMVAAAELHLRTKQFDEAIDKLNRVVELHAQGKAEPATGADARFLLGEAYFADQQLHSARREFEYITDHHSEPGYSDIGGRAASRLVDIALRTDRKDLLQDVLGRVERLRSQAGADPSLAYARSKVLFALERYDEAQAQAENLTGTTLYAQRADYLRGTVLMKEAQRAADQADDASSEPPDFDPAILAFQEATKTVVDEDDEDHKSERIADLAWLAIGRLHYEAKEYLPAIAAYQKVKRGSEYFGRALYELAWTFVRMEDYDRAQRALEVLSALEPELLDGADAALLRGDLLLRSGKFQSAEEAYLGVKTKFNPVQRQLADFLEQNEDPVVYYDKLTALDVEAGNDIPQLAIAWAREEAREDRAFAIVDDVARSRDLIQRSERIITLLRAAIGSSARAKLFPEVRRQLERAEALVNRLAIARIALARGMDRQAGSVSGELAQVRQRRRALMDRLGRVPLQAGDFSVRETRAKEAWNAVSQKLQRIQLEADHLQALVNGLREVLSNARRHGVDASPESLARFRQELEESKKELALYRERIETLREQIEIGRVQSGFGDERFQEDAKVRERFRELFTREVSMVAAGADSSDATAYAQSIQPLLGAIAAEEAKIERVRAKLDSESRARASEISAIVETEAEKIEAYSQRLDTLDESARALVGRVARANFVKVKERLKNVVMRADIGLVQKSWEKRTEQKFRVRQLLRERAREEKFINDELREVLDEAEGSL